MRWHLLPVAMALIVSCGGESLDADGIDAVTSTSEVTAPGPLPSVWSPAPGATWQWQLTGPIDLSVEADMYDVDLFDVPAETIDALHRDRRIVVCYFSAGSVEDWRPDADRFPRDVVGHELEGWPGERWLDVSRFDEWSHVMESRLDLAVAKGCDGVEPDNVDAHLADTGFAIGGDDQIAYNTWLAAAAHERNLSVGLKNDLPQVEALVDHFDWLLVEECVEFEECDGVLPFIAAAKAVFAAEYTSVSAEACAVAARLGMSLIFKAPDLGPARDTCAPPVSG